MKYPETGLVRMSGDVRAAEVEGSDMRTLVGTPVVFDIWTEIHGWEGDFRERIKPGAADVTIADRGDKIQVLYNHGFDPSIGQKPLGKIKSIRADKIGVHVEVPLSDTSFNRDLQVLLEDLALDGMSFRFDVIADQWEKMDSDLPERTITELRLHEVGPVTFPAYEAAAAGVRSGADLSFYTQRMEHLLGVDPTAPGIGSVGPAQRHLAAEEISRFMRDLDISLLKGAMG